MAEGVGFEPTVELPLHGISSAAPSATRPPLLHHCDLLLRITCTASIGQHHTVTQQRDTPAYTSADCPNRLAPRSTWLRHVEDKLAEGRGFEPPRDLRPYPISSRTPSTGLGHPSAECYQLVTPHFSIDSGHRNRQSPSLVQVPQHSSRSCDLLGRAVRQRPAGDQGRDASTASPCSGFATRPGPARSSGRLRSSRGDLQKCAEARATKSPQDGSGSGPGP